METKFNLIKNRCISSKIDGKTGKVPPCDVIDIRVINQFIEYFKQHKKFYMLSHLDRTKTEDENLEMKNNSPGLQVFNTGKREKTPDDITNDNISNWNGFIVVDIDSKIYKGKYEKVLRDDRFCEMFHERCTELPTHTYMGIQRSFSGNSFHIYFGYDCEKTNVNFMKCAECSAYMVKLAFERCGMKEVIKCKGVLDNCTLKNKYQPVYLTDYPFYINEEFTGSLYWYPDYNMLDDYDVKEDPEVKEKKQITLSDDQEITWTDKYINDFTEWRHEERKQFIIILGMYTGGDKKRAHDIYEKFVTEFIMKLPDDQRGGHGFDYIMKNFDTQFTPLYKGLEKGIYSTNYKMLLFFKNNLGINFETDTDEQKYMNKRNHEKCYRTKKVYKESMCF